MASYETRGKNKLISIRFHYINEQGQRQHMRLSGFKSKKAANEAYIEWLAEHPKYKAVATKNDGIIYFRDLAQKYFDYIKHVIRDNTYDGYVIQYKKYISTYFDQMKIKDITPGLVLEWQTWVNKTFPALSAHYKQSIRDRLHSIFKHGTLYGYANVVSGLRSFQGTPPREMDFWEPQEFLQFIKVVDDFTYNAYFSTLFTCGLRKGEAAGLQVADINLKERYINVDKTLVKHSSNDYEFGSYGYHPPKSKNGKRVVYYPDYMHETFVQLVNQAQTRPNYKPNNFLFVDTSIRLQHLSFNTMRTRFKNYVKLAGVKDIRIHDLRHSHVSYLINEAKDVSNPLTLVYMIAKRIGDNPDQILKTYGHLFSQKHKDIISNLDDINLYDMSPGAEQEAENVGKYLGTEIFACERKLVEID